MQMLASLLCMGIKDIHCLLCVAIGYEKSQQMRRAVKYIMGRPTNVTTSVEISPNFK